MGANTPHIVSSGVRTVHVWFPVRAVAEEARVNASKTGEIIVAKCRTIIDCGRKKDLEGPSCQSLVIRELRHFSNTKISI